jgi:hypothetical protein
MIHLDGTKKRDQIHAPVAVPGRRLSGCGSEDRSHLPVNQPVGSHCIMIKWLLFTALLTQRRRYIPLKQFRHVCFLNSAICVLKRSQNSLITRHTRRPTARKSNILFQRHASQLFIRDLLSGTLRHATLLHPVSAPFLPVWIYFLAKRKCRSVIQLVSQSVSQSVWTVYCRTAGEWVWTVQLPDWHWTFLMPKAANST